MLETLFLMKQSLIECLGHKTIGELAEQAQAVDAYEKQLEKYDVEGWPKLSRVQKLLYGSLEKPTGE